MHIYNGCSAPMPVSKLVITSIVVAVVAIAIASTYAYMLYISTSKLTTTTVIKTTTATRSIVTTKTSTVTLKLTSTVSKVVTVTSTTEVKVVKKVPTKPKLIADIVIAKKEELPPSTYVAIYSWWSHAPYTPVVFSPNSKYFAVGIVKFISGKSVAEVRVYTVDGKLLWRYSLGSGYLYSMAWTKDSRELIIGTQSVSAKIIALNVTNGEVIWSYDVSKDLGHGKPGEFRWRWPTVYSIDTYGSNVYAVACKSILKPYTKICKIYGFNSLTGKRLWVSPSKGFIDTAVPWLRVSPNGKYLAAITWYYVGKYWRGGTLILIDASTGRIIKSFYPGPRPPFTWVGSWRGVAWLSSDYVAFCLDDGRLYVLKVPTLRVIEEVNVTTPLPALVMPRKASKATEGYVYAFAGYAYAARGTNSTILIVRTSNTYGLLANGGSAKPLINHPDALSLFFYVWREGKLSFIAKYPLRGRPCYYQNYITYSPKLNLIAVPVGHDYVTRTYVHTGLYIYNLTSIKLLAAGYGEALIIKPPVGTGVVISGAISPNGRYAVVITYPINVGSEKHLKPVGLYGIYVYRIS